MELKVLLNGPVPFNELSELYTLVGWNKDGSRTPDALKKMIEKTSHYVTAFKGPDLIGFGRFVTDEIFLFQLTDVMVHPDHRQQGAASLMLKMLLDSLPPTAETIRMIDGFLNSSIWEKLGYHTVPAERVMYALLEKDKKS